MNKCRTSGTQATKGPKWLYCTVDTVNSRGTYWHGCTLEMSVGLLWSGCMFDYLQIWCCLVFPSFTYSKCSGKRFIKYFKIIHSMMIFSVTLKITALFCEHWICKGTQAARNQNFFGSFRRKSCY